MILWNLLVAHFVCDFPLQGDFLARGKNHRASLPNTPWFTCLVAHAVIQGAGVALVTGSLFLGMMELSAHCFIDFGKSDGWYGFNVDQGLHILCKLAWLAALQMPLHI